MKNSILILSIMIVTLSNTIYAGGKRVIYAESPVAPIENVDPSAWYLGAGLVWAKLGGCDLVNCEYEDVTYGAMLRGGYDYNQYVGLEARYIRTFLDEGPFGGTPLEHMGIYLKPQYPMSEHVNVYALLGYGYTKNLGNGARLDYFDSDSGFAAGLGIEYDLSDRKGDKEENALYDREFDGYADQGRGWSLFLDYQRLLIKSDVPDLNAISLGLRYDF